MKADIEILLQTLPESPGVYQFFDTKERYLYIGKAKNLKKRVQSYFQKNHDNNKIRSLVRQVNSIKHIVVERESDALLLENNLIKTHQPKYNIMLRDDKTYPWICIKNEPFPRVFYTRNLIKDGSEYFGPYTNVKTVNVLLETIRKLYPLRSCKYDLSQKNIQAKKYKLCLEYHLKNCKGPCENLQSEASYMTQIRNIRNIIKGNVKECLTQLKSDMNLYAHQLDFEAAQIVKDKIIALENYHAKSTVVNPKINNVNVFSIISDYDFAYVNFLQIKNGAIIRSHTSEIKKKLNETDKHILEFFMVDIALKFKSAVNEIITPFPVSIPFDGKVVIPKIGDKKHLLNLSIRNAQFYRQDKLKQTKITDPQRHAKRIMAQMKADLRLSQEPRHIECFDNSNIQGAYPVAACVVFKNVKPSKKDYRHFNIKTVEGPNDFDSMKEVIFRRYKRLLEENQPLPQLIIIDGGKGQLSSALESLEALKLKDKIAIISIAKRLEEIFFPEDSIPLYLEKSSETLKIIQQLRNEAHRFGISFHRNKRSSNALKSELEEIEGIGKQTYAKLLKHFKSMKRIKEVKSETLSEVVGKDKADKIINYFQKNY